MGGVTGLYYYGARYYDPITSLWVNVDPSWDAPDQVNKSPYIYVMDNPVIYVDPDGKKGTPASDQGNHLNGQSNLDAPTPSLAPAFRASAAARFANPSGEIFIKGNNTGMQKHEPAYVVQQRSAGMAAKPKPAIKKSNSNAIRATAFARGTDIHIAENFGTQSMQAHEGTHVVQQKQGRMSMSRNSRRK